MDKKTYAIELDDRCRGIRINVFKEKRFPEHTISVEKLTNKDTIAEIFLVHGNGGLKSFYSSGQTVVLISLSAKEEHLGNKNVKNDG